MKSAYPLKKLAAPGGNVDSAHGPISFPCSLIGEGVDVSRLLAQRVIPQKNFFDNEPRGKLGECCGESGGDFLNKSGDQFFDAAGLDDIEQFGR